MDRFQVRYFFGAFENAISSGVQKAVFCSDDAERSGQQRDPIAAGGSHEDAGVGCSVKTPFLKCDRIDIDAGEPAALPAQESREDEHHASFATYRMCACG